MSGCEEFAALVESLICEVSEYVYPEIGRTRSTDWMAFIFDHHAKDRRTKLASGQAGTLDAACADCVADYHKRKCIAARKAELMENPDVREALELFGHNAKHTGGTSGDAAGCDQEGLK